MVEDGDDGNQCGEYGESEEGLVTSTREKVMMSLQLAVPTMLASIVQKFQEIINLRMIGYQTHLEPHELRAMMAGCGLGNMT